MIEANGKMKKSTKQRPFIATSISEDDKNKSSTDKLKEDAKQTGEQHGILGEHQNGVTGEHQNKIIDTNNKEFADPQLDEFFKVRKPQFLVEH